MKPNPTVCIVAIGLCLVGTAVFVAGQPAASAIVATRPVYVPDISHANDPLPDGVFAWDELSKATNAAADQQVAHFVFNFTNIATAADITLVTNITASTTNIAVITNSIKPCNVTILGVRPSCGCTTAELPPLPWTIAPGIHGQIGLTVNIQGKSGTLYKTAVVSTDKGSKTLILGINILPPVIPKMTAAERARGIAAAKIDRQAVFRGDCAKCHVNNIQGKYGKPLFDSVCALCHEAEQRATMVPDLHNLKTPTNDEFWRTWIAHGKPGSLMPAFATSDGGPLTDIQIASLAAYLNSVIPSQVPLNK